MGPDLLRLPGKVFQPWLSMLLILGLSGLFVGPDPASAVPTVTAISPPAGAVNVPAAAAITATFSEPLEPATITPGSITLSQSVRIRAISAGYNNTLALRDNGTVIGWGYNGNGQISAPAGLSSVTAIATGSNHSAALKSDGTVVAWGDNTWGQTTVPTGLAEVIAIAAGGNFTLALHADKTVVAWGDGSYGQTVIPGGLAGVIAIAAGNAHALAIKADSSVAAWGDNSSGQTTIPPGLFGVRTVAAGLNHSVALKADGTVVAWGANNKGQTAVPAGLTGVVAISATLDFTLALKNDGTVVAWGDNNSGQAYIPADLPKIAAIAAGYYHSVAIKNDGTVISWGNNSYSQTTLPAGLTGVAAVAAGKTHTVALKNNGTIFAWGYNDAGQAVIPAGLSGINAIAAGAAHTMSLSSSGVVNAWGRNDYGQTTVPTELAGVTAIAAGDNHSVAIKNDGTVVTWGLNYAGVPAGLTGVTEIAAGAAHTVALKTDGNVTAWGSNNHNAVSIPAGLTGVTAIAAGGYHSVALKTDGTLSAWGDNTWGQSTIPPDLADVIAIAAGYSHTAALKSDGTVVAWGANLFGQCTVPAGLAGVVAIAAGNSYTIAVKNDGTLVGWGENISGQAATPQDPYLQPLAIAVSYSTGSNSITINPDAALPPATTLAATVNTGIRSLDGTHPTVDYSWSFITADPVPPVTTASPAGGTYSSPLNVTLTANEPATIYYTTNGNDPTSASTIYSGSIPIPANTSLKFFARDAAGNSETIKTSAYTINFDTTPPLTTATPAGGTYSSAQSVTLTANEPATIYYTTNGSSPTISSAVYSGPIPVPATTSLKFFARDPSGNSETVRTAIYTIRQNQTIIFNPLAAKTYGNPSFSLSATASSGLPVSYTSSNTAVATISGTTVTIVAAGLTTITANQGGDGNYNPAAAVAQVLTVNKAVLTVQAANASREYGLANPALSATYSGFINGDTQAVLSGSAEMSAAATATSPVGVYPITAAAGTLAAANYCFSFINGTLTVIKAGQTITFAALPAITYGDPAFTLSATAGSNLPVSYASSNSSVVTVSGNTLTIVGAGSATITASQGGDDAYNPAPAVAQAVTVNKAVAAVSLGSLSTFYDGTPRAATATTTPAGLSIIFTYNGLTTAPTAVASYTVVGTVSDPNYLGSASGTMTIAKGNQTITFGALPAKTYGNPAFTLTAAASSGLAVTYTSSNSAVATVSGSTVTIIGAGTATLTGTQSGDANYNAALAVAQTLTVNKAPATITFGSLAFVYDNSPKPVTVTTVPAGLAVAITYDGSATAPTDVGNYIVVATVNDANYQGSATASEEISKKSQTITFGPLPVKTYGDTPFLFSADASSNLNLTFAYDTTVASIVKQGQKYLLTIVGAGTTVITATQPGNRNYSDAPPVSQTLTVNKAAATVTLGNLSATYDGTAKAATATTSPFGLGVTFSYNGSATPPTDAGSYTVVGTINNPNYQGSASGTLTIAKAGQAVSFGALPAKAYGNAPFIPIATASSSLAISFASSNPAVATVSGGTVTITGVGTTIITASQGGDGNYNAASAVPQTLTVSKGTATVTLGGLNSSYNGTARAATAITVPNGLPLTLTYNGSATAPTAAGSYTVAAIVTSPNYQGSTSGTLTIARGTQTITFGTLPVKTFGNAPFTLSASSSSGLTITCTSSNPAVATVNSTTVTIVSAGTAIITASQGGDGNYEAASAVAQTLIVNTAQPTGGKTAVTIGVATSYYDTVTAAFAAITPGTTVTIKLQTLTFTEAVNLNVSGATVSFSGGYDSNFTSAAGMTVIQGNLTINAGTLIADRLVIM